MNPSIEVDNTILRCPENRQYVSGVKVMRFGYELFSPVIPPPICALNTDSTTMDDITAAINPQDIILTSRGDATNVPIYNDSSWLQLSLQQSTDLFNGSAALAIAESTGYIETVRSPYSSLGDKFFSTITVDKISLPNPIPLDDGNFNHGMLLPSSAISQSEILFDENPLGFFDENSALVEHYFNSGITNSAASFCETTMDNNNILTMQKQKSSELIPTSASFLNAYDEEDATSVETGSIASSKEEEEGFSVLVMPKTIETRIKILIKELNNLIREQLSYTKYNTTFRKIKKEYKEELKNAVDIHYSNNPLYAEIRQLRNLANDKVKLSEASSQKRKREDVEEMQTANEKDKKRRQNYNADIIDVLMDWYLINNGKIPTHAIKKELADITGKSDIQISTWFQNARRRYHKKLQTFQELSSNHPELVHNYQTMKSYLKSKN